MLDQVDAGVSEKRGLAAVGDGTTVLCGEGEIKVLGAVAGRLLGAVVGVGYCREIRRKNYDTRKKINGNPQ